MLYFVDSVAPDLLQSGESQDFGTASSSASSISAASAHHTFSRTVYSDNSQINFGSEVNSQQEETLDDAQESRNDLFGSMNDTIFSMPSIHTAPLIALPSPSLFKEDAPQASPLEKNMTSPELLPGVEYSNININNYSKNVNKYTSFGGNALATDVKKGAYLYGPTSPSTNLHSSSADLDKMVLSTPPTPYDEKTILADEAAFYDDEAKAASVEESLVAADLAPAPTPDPVVVVMIEPEQTFVPPMRSPQMAKGKHPVNHSYWQPDAVVVDSKGTLSIETVGIFAILGAHGCYLSVSKRPVAHIFPVVGKLLPPMDKKFPVCCNITTYDSDEEKWVLHRLWNGSKWVIAFQNVASKCFMCVEDNGCLYAHRTEANAWERFEVELDRSDKDGKLVSFKTLKSNGSYLCVVKPGEGAKMKPGKGMKMKHANGCEAICDRTSVGPWEKFSLVRIV